MKKDIILLFITVVIMAVLSEIFLWMFLPIGDPYRLWKEGQVTEKKYIESEFQPNQEYRFYPESELSGMGQMARFTTNNMGFRGPEIIRPKPENEYRVFMVGGSTTECVYLDDTLAVSSVLQDYLNRHLPDSLDVKVYNAGKSGDCSYDHLAMISQRIVHLQPDMIILFCGINDLTAAIYEADYLHMPHLSGARISPAELVKYLLTESQLFRRLYYAYKGIFSPPSGDDLLTSISFKSNYREKVRMRKAASPAQIPPRTDLEPYVKNLESIAGLACIHGFRLILMTQATTYDSQTDPRTSQWIWGTYKNGVTYREEDIAMAMRSYNKAMREVARNHNIPIFDLALLMPKSLDYFYDDCHFNIEGSIKAGNLLGAFIMENNLVN